MWVRSKFQTMGGKNLPTIASPHPLSVILKEG